MTAKISASANQATISVGNQPVANIPATSGLPFCKNKLLNGEVTRINQRNFDGNWTPKGNYPPAGTIAQKEATYGYDQWAKADATNMLQVIEAGNFRHSTVHTLSGQNVTTQQITSPASGNWTITVPQTARYVQLEEGVEATPFEIRPIAFEMAQCQRYYQVLDTEVRWDCIIGGSSVSAGYFFPFRVYPRTIPSIDISITDGVNSTSPSINVKDVSGVELIFAWTTDGVITRSRATIIKASAVL